MQACTLDFKRILVAFRERSLEVQTIADCDEPNTITDHAGEALHVYLIFPT